MNIIGKTKDEAVVVLRVAFRCTVVLTKMEEVLDIPHCHRVEPTDEIYHRYSRQSRELDPVLAEG